MTPILLAEGDAVTTATGLLTTVTGQLSLANLALVVGAGLGAGLALFLFWWAARYLVRKVKVAFARGKLSA